MPRAPADQSDVEELTDAVLVSSRALVAVAARSLADVENDVTLPQYRVLVFLEGRGPLKPGDLADELGIHASTVTRLCDRLVAKGLITRSVHPDSRREVVLEISEAGRAVVSQVRARRRREIDRIVRRVPRELRPAMVRGLQAFAEAAGEVPEQAWSLGWERR